MSVPTHVPTHVVRPLEWFQGDGMEDDPNAAYRRFFEGDGVFYTPRSDYYPFGAWVLVRSDDIRHVLDNPQLFTSRGTSGFDEFGGVREDLIPVNIDPPRHTLYRRILTPFFSPARIRSLEGAMEEGVDSVIDEIIGQGTCDIVPHGYRMMAAVWGALMGVPRDRSQSYIRFIWAIVHQSDPQVRRDCLQDMLIEMERIFEENAGKPGEGLINAFVNANIEGRPISKPESVGFILFMFLAGMDTMGSTTSWILRHLAQDVAMRRALIANPDRIPAYVDEIIRRYAITSTRRVVATDTTIGRYRLKQGDYVITMLRLACLDPDMFAAPAVVDPERSEKRNLAFGSGPHFCIGSPIAKAQLPIMVRRWLARIPDFSIREGTVSTAHIGDVIGLNSLHLTWRHA